MGILSIVTWLPLVGALALLALPKERTEWVRLFANVWMALCFVVTLPLLAYDRELGGIQFVEDATWIPLLGARYSLGVDGISIALVMLTALLGPIASLASWSAIDRRQKEFYAFLLAMQTTMIGVFVAMDLFLFFVFWEISLVPMYFIIGIWGGERRLYAAIKFFVYTLAGSVVMLLAILKLYSLTTDPATIQALAAIEASARTLAGRNAEMTAFNHSMSALACE